MLKIVSGAQTGVDRGALDAALEAGMPCGGWCPAGRFAEDGAIPAKYPVSELAGGGYADRTLQNVLDSDATLVIYFGRLEGGTELTVRFCMEQRKPCQLIDARKISESRAVALSRAFIAEHGIQVLNVAGPRASKQLGAHRYAFTVIRGLL
ncbi:MAG: hypothetical protein GY862_36120 [Gammaproteobacteria bacterium]|nr:hypothetical protein [Gammaproteobacteria bacterium]